MTERNPTQSNEAREPVRLPDIEVRRRRIATVLGLVASALFLWLALRRLSLEELTGALATARPWPWIPLAVATYLTGHCVRGLRCQTLVRDEAHLPLPTATNIVVLGYAVNNLLPARLGELARAALLGDRAGIPFAQGLTLTLLERILDGWAIVLLFAVALSRVPSPGEWLLYGIGFAGIVFGSASLLTGVLLFAPHRSALVCASWAGRLRKAWYEPVWRTVVYVGNGVAPLKRPANALRLALLSLIVWCIEALMFALLLPVFGLPIKLEWALLAMTVTNLAILIPSSPGYLGSFHFFCAQALIGVGVAATTATFYASCVHVVFYVPITVWGAGLLWRYGMELGSVALLSRTAARTPQVFDVEGVRTQLIGSVPLRSRPAEPGRLLTAITEALSPLNPPPNPDTLAQVARFVHGQVIALSWKMRAAMLVGFTGFRILVRARYGRSFCDLPLATRRRVVAYWAYGPHFLARQLFRLLRSTTLLAHYEIEPAAHAGRPGVLVGALE